jgi:hypothetical protein
MAENSLAAEGDASQAQSDGGTQPSARRIAVTDSSVHVGYANFCCVASTAEEVLLDFGLSAKRFGQPHPSIQITHRLALSYATAQRLFGALRTALQPRVSASPANETNATRQP